MCSGRLEQREGYCKSSNKPPLSNKPPTFPLLFFYTNKQLVAEGDVTIGLVTIRQYSCCLRLAAILKIASVLCYNHRAVIVAG